MHKLGLKIIFGFLLLTATLCAAVWFIIRSARSVYDISDIERTVAAQRRASDQLQTCFLETATLTENLLLQYSDDAAVSQYIGSSERTDTALCALRALTPDSLQCLRLDSLRALMFLKRNGTLELVEALRNENERGSSLQKQISELRSGTRPVKVEAQVPVPVVEHGEQVIIERRKKGFFNRLGDVFRKGKDDTVKVATTTHEALNDTALTKVNISDTLANILTNVHRNLSENKAQQAERISLKSGELRTSGAELSKRTAALMEDITAEQQRTLFNATEKERERRTHAAWQMGGLAVLTTLLSLCLFLWLWRDMKRVNRYRKALEAAKTKAENLMVRREQLLLTISHDIKAPVNTILGYLQIIRNETALAKELNAIRAAAAHLRNLVAALLDYHKLEADGVTLAPVPTHLLRLLDEIADAFRPQAEQKGLLLRTWLELAPELTIETDAFRLRQVIENLLSNAVKYTQQGEILIAARLDGPHLFLEVRDTGCGLAPHDLNRIFEPFTRVKGSEGQEGVGLGLSITQKIVGLMGGTLSAQSEPGVGSTFQLEIPYKVAAQAEAADEDGGPTVPETLEDDTPKRTECAEQLCPQTVALLDDDILQLQLTEAMLRNVVGAEVTLHPFNAPDDLFDWIASGNRPDLLLTDIEMPTLTGYEVLKRVRNINGLEHLPVIAMTSHSLVNAEDLRAYGFSHVLFKPFNQNDLREVGLGNEGRNQWSEKAGTDNHPASQENSGNVRATAKRSPFNALLKFAAGDTVAERQILDQFRQDCENHQQQLTQAFAARDKTTVCRLSHKMLPTFSLICSPAEKDLRMFDMQRGSTEWTEADTVACRRILLSLNNILESLA